jgi:glycosyltransferase involved in cell wall biosynthesis
MSIGQTKHTISKTNSDRPVFSVIIPTYNRAHVITRAIQSVLEQTFSNFELIIVDDGSTDQTDAVIGSINHPRLRYIRQENKGVSAARNAGVALAHGQYVTFLDSDDEVLPEWLANLAQVFQAGQAGIVCVGSKVIIEQNGQHQQTIVLPRKMGALFEHQEGLFAPPGTFALRRELFETVGGYVEGLPFSENTELAIRLIPHCIDEGWSIVSLAKPLVLYHKQPFDESKAHTNYKVRSESVAYVLARHRAKFKKDARAYGYFLAGLGVCVAKMGEYSRARHYFKSAILAQPWNWRHYGRFLLALMPIVARKYWLRHDANL